MLLAFAALADQAGRRPRSVRIVVLWLLRSVEAIASDFVIAVAGGVDADFDPGVDPGLAVMPHARDIADDAARLARSFAALACLLADLIRHSPLARGRIGGHSIQMLGWMLARRNLALAPGALARPRLDTS